MKLIKFLSAILLLSIMGVSCTKESNTVVEEIEPEIVVLEDTLSAGVYRIGLDTQKVKEANLYTWTISGSNLVYDYQLDLDISIPGISHGNCGWFSIPPNSPTETALQEETYYGDINFPASWVTQEGIDTLQAWQDAGSDPNTVPDIYDYFIYYDATDMTYIFSDVTATNAKVEISGEIIDPDGTPISVSGEFLVNIN